MNNERFLRIISGNFDEIPREKSKIVKIFLSSTFSGKLIILSLEFFCNIKTHRIDLTLRLDTHAERDYLIANVYPKLKTYCKSKYGIDFQVIFNNKMNFFA